MHGEHLAPYAGLARSDAARPLRASSTTAARHSLSAPVHLGQRQPRRLPSPEGSCPARTHQLCLFAAPVSMLSVRKMCAPVSMLSVRNM